ncbi:MAG TPA: ABC transporter permease [Stackebrandtia sp.]|jgi:ABC-2 type transport system permease protein|uniref:ABC transporter permease n=1 Tax=Stackebrandtia sp. TaxID=2023065 RepID=UPI002D3D4AEC|nr:ABC transporter permease [Stackebrandtia sp.]HZE40589.1 ABC transporter permease [Stackebrandtia sp.]
MNTLTGTGKLIRFMLRRDRVLLPVWVLVFAYVPAGLVPGIKELYPTQAAREQIAHSIGATPAFTALMGPVYDPSLGGLVAWRGSLVTLILGIITGLTVIRHTRTDEEAGRRELIGSAVVGRHANLASTLIVTIAATAVGTGLLTAGLISQNLDGADSLALGLQYGATGVVFACVAAVCAQLTRGAGSARAIMFVVLGASFLLRMGGNLNKDMKWMLWISPAGWAQELRPFADNKWWVLWIVAAVCVVLVALAFVLQSHRDIEAGVLPTRLGRPQASPMLSNSFGLAWRLQRGAFIGWAIAFILIGYMLGSMGKGVQDMLRDNKMMTQIVAQMGGSHQLTSAFIASMIGLMGLAVTGYSLQAAVKPRAEENATHAENLLATGVSRLSWQLSHLVFAFIGPAVVLALGGLAMVASYAAVIDDPSGAFGDVMRGAAVQLPAVWVLTALAVLLYGVLPRVLSLVWVALVLCLVFGQLGSAFQLPQWALDISPFTHLPKVPGHDITAQPLLWLGAIAIVATVVGLGAFRRRDITA